MDKKGDIRNALASVERLVVQGRIQEARASLSKASKGHWDRTLSYRIANLATRTQQPFKALKLLHSYAYPKDRQIQLIRGSAKERAEYAYALTQVGASEEALAILNSIDDAVCPLALFYRAFALFSLWNYSAAVPLLTAYVSRSDISLYQYLLGCINLAAALVREQKFNQAQILLTTIEGKIEKSYPLLFQTLLLLRAQGYLFSGKYDDADHALQIARQKVVDPAHVSSFLIRKWEIALQLLKDPLNQSALKALKDFKQEVKKIHSEIYRDCDRIQATLLKDDKLLYYLYFGTPFPPYRTRLLKDFGDSIRVPEYYEWNLRAKDGRERKNTSIFDIKEGTFGQSQLNKGGVLHKLLQALTLDFYRPMRVGDLFFHLFPENIFDPSSSPNRVAETVRRLRSWFKQHKIPLDITTKRGFFQLVALSSVTLRLEKDERVEDRFLMYKTQLAEKWKQEPFSTLQVQELLKLSERSSQRLLSMLIQRGNLSRSRTKRSIYYYFIPH